MTIPTRQIPLCVCLATTLLAVTPAAAAPPAPPPQGGQVLWRFEVPGSAVGRFVGVDTNGRVYTTNFDPPNLYAISPNGLPIWSLNLGIAGGEWPISFDDDGTIYTGAVGVRAVNPDGTLRWAYDPGSWILAGPTLGPDGRIYAADDPRSGGIGFFSLDRDGHLLWSDIGSPEIFGLYSTCDEIVFGANRLFAGIHFPRSGPWVNSYAFDFGGQQLWTRYYTADGGPSSNPRQLPDGRLVYRWGQGELGVLNPNGADDWVVPHPDGAQVLVTPAIGPDGAIYAGDEYGVQLWSVRSDGTTRWVKAATTNEHLAGEGLAVSPDNRVLVAGGTTYFPAEGLNHGWVRGYDTSDGSLLWQVDLEDEQGLCQLTRTVRPGFSSTGDRVYVTTWFAGSGVGHCYVYAISLRDGTVGVPIGETAGLDAAGVSIQPNPCLSAATVQIRAGSTQRVSVTVHDLAGRVVRRLFEGLAPAGSMRLDWDLRDGNGRKVDPGVYLVSAGTPASRGVAKLVVTR